VRVIVIGGGIAGISAAVALQGMGMESEVFEARDRPDRSGGLFLTLAVNGLRVLRQLGLLDAVLATNPIPTPEIVFQSGTGKTLGRATNGRLEDGRPSVTLARSSLHEALQNEAAQRGIRIHPGKRLKGASSIGRGVRASFEDGTSVEGDLLIGADGIHSAVRALVDPAGRGPSFTGLLNLGGVCPEPPAPATPNVMRMVWGRKAFFGYTVPPGGEALWFANVSVREEPSRDALARVGTDAWRKDLLRTFEADPACVGALIEATPTIAAYPIHDLRELPRWRAGRMVLVGDAAHAVSPSTGQGASLALEDAAALALFLAEGPSVEEALDAFVQARRPRAARMVAEGRRRGAYKAPGSAWSLRIRDLLMPMALRVFASDRRLAWMHEYTVPWPSREADARVLVR